MNMPTSRLSLQIMMAVTMCGLTAQAQQATPSDESAELAKKLANPVASLISVPLQFNYDRNFGADDQGSKSVLNIQPVIPLTLNDEWNLITRTIVPLVDQQDLPVSGQNTSGLGDITASQFFSPRQPTAGGWIWGAGPVELLPTASNDLLGGEQWGLGPTAVVLKQVGPWTFGALANHIWSMGGAGDRADLSTTFVQPFLSFITPTKTTLGINTESSYDWQQAQWAVPVNLTVSQLLKVGPQILQLSLGARYWVETPASGPEGFGFRAAVTFLYPK